MPVNHERLNYLLQKYLQKTSSREEFEEFLTMLSDTEGREGIRSFMDAHWENQPADTRADEVDWDFMFDRLIDRRVQNTAAPVAAPLIPRQNRFRLRPLTAAAVIFLGLCLSTLFGTVTYWWFNRSGKSSDSLSQARDLVIKDIAPGHNGAVLTLADGKQIVLDSAHNGELTAQGKTEIVKEGGSIAYKGREVPDKILYNIMSTPKGRQYQLVLADGSKVWLNSASSIRFPTAFPGDLRSVEITGEVYFEIAPDKTKPFHVKLNDQDIQVLGTHFNINAYPDERFTRTSLTEGSVKISSGKDEYLLTRGQQAVLDKTSGRTRVVEEVNMENVLAWKNGFFNFENADLPAVMRQLARWYDVEIVYSKDIPKERFNGEIDCNLSLASVLKILEKTHVHFRIDDKKIVILP